MSMKRAWLLVLLVAAWGGIPAQTRDEEVWNDPEFKKSFLGTYGVHPDVEPRIGPEDRVVLEKVYPLLGTNPDEAARLIEESKTPESSAIFDFVLGNLDFQADQLDEAERHYQEAVTRFPSFRRAWRNLGLIQARDQRYTPAIVSFTKMIELGGGDAISYGLLGGAYLSKDDYLAAESAFRQALLLEPQNAQWRIGLARAVVKQEKYEEAAALLNVLIEHEPDRSEFWLLQANAYIGMKQPLKAAENLEMLSLRGQASASNLSLLGDLYLNEGQTDLATGAYLRGIALDPAQPIAPPLRAAQNLASRGAMGQAKLVSQAIRARLTTPFDPEQSIELSKLDARVAAGEGRGVEAIRILEEVVALDPLDGDALLLIGQHYAEAGEAEHAIIYFERAENIQAVEAQARLRHAQVFVSQGKYDQAVPLLKRAQEIKPREQVARYLEQVERLARAGS